MRLLPQTMLPHQGEAPSNAVQNKFPTMRAKRCWGRSTGQRLPPRSEAISHDRSHRRAVISSLKRDRNRKNRARRKPRRTADPPPTPRRGRADNIRPYGLRVRDKTARSAGKRRGCAPPYGKTFPLIGEGDRVSGGRVETVSFLYITPISFCGKRRW